MRRKTHAEPVAGEDLFHLSQRLHPLRSEAERTNMFSTALGDHTDTHKISMPRFDVCHGHPHDSVNVAEVIR